MIQRLINSGLILQRLFVGELQEQEAHREEHGEERDRYVDRTSGQLDPRDDSGTQEGSAFREDIVYTEVLTGVLRRDDLGIVGTGQRLDGTLEAADAERQDAEMPDRGQEQRVDTHAEITENTDQDQRDGLVLGGEFREDKGTQPRDDLGRQQEDYLSNGIEAEVGTDVDTVVDDRSDTVDIKEESDQEEQDLLIGKGDLLEGAADLFESLGDRAFFGFDIVDLLVVFDQRDGDEEPPHTGDGETDETGKESGNDFQHVRPENVGDERDKERDAGSDITPGIAVGRDLVHPIFGGHVVQHRVVEGERCLIEDLRQDIDDDEQHPVGGEAVDDTADHAERDRGRKEDLLGILVIRDGAEDRAHQRDDDRHDSDGDGVIRGCLVAGDLSGIRADGERLEPDGDQGAGQHRKGGIADVVQDPGFLLLGQILEHKSLLSNM